ncbi:MAG: HNH endonuclease [Candidatus Nanopelagicales bacterium]|nr:HNH endonuclease [Candidatus Nanopelagicales bacterium]MCF8557746.1 HNH endonuclease [Candidatus Nanopelagicales bacterium]
MSQIQETFDSAPSALEGVLQGLVGDEGRLVVAVDGVRVLGGDKLPAHEWGTFSVECEKPLRRVTRGGDQVLDAAVEVAGAVLAVVLAGLPVEPVEEIESVDGAGLPEGASVRVVVNRYERSAANRMACIAHYGLTCQACGIDFARAYGPLGDDFIHVHHRTPVSQLGEGYVVNPVADLIPVCPNCHAMLHRRSPPLDYQELRDILAVRRLGEEGPSASET